MTLRPLGWNKDAPDPTERKYGVHGKAFQGFRELPTPDLRDFRHGRFEQIGSSCVAYAFKRCVQIGHSLQGIEKPILPSATYAYTAARRQKVKHVRPLPPLEDGGCQPRLLLQAIAASGYAPENVWPEDGEHLNLDPTPSVGMSSIDQSGAFLDWIAIDGVHETRIDAFEECLRKAMPPMFGILVDTPYCEWVGCEPIGDINPGDIQGGHMQTLLAIDRAKGIGIVDNWWTRNWGCEDGLGVISLELLGSPFVDDCYALRSVASYNRS